MKNFLLFLVLVLSFMFSNNLYASHAMGADLEYECLGSNQYRIRLKFYRDCSGISAPTNPVVTVQNVGCGGGTTLNVPLTLNTGYLCSNGSVAGSNGCEVSPLCPSQLPFTSCNTTAYTYPGVQVYEYTGIVTLPTACTQWIIGFTESARNFSNNLSSQPNLSIQAMINNALPPLGPDTCQNSAKFTELPVPFKCSSQSTTYNHGAVDQDGDSLRFAIVNPLGNGYAPIGFAAGYSTSQPIKTNPPNTFQFDSATGQMIFTPLQNEVDVLAIKVFEYRNGVLVGFTMRDVQVTMISCNITIPLMSNIQNVVNGNLLDTVSVQTCPGTTIQFDVVSRDPAGKNLIVTSTLQQGSASPLPGAIFTNTNMGVAPNDTVRSTVIWTPAASDTGCHTFIIKATNDDCPIKGTITKVFRVCVLTKVTVTPHFAVYCGDSIQLAATGGTNFSWSPLAGLSNPNSYTPKAGPAVTTRYTFTSDCGTDTSLIVVNPPFSNDAGLGGNICIGGQLPLNATVGNTYAPYVIKWTPSTGLVDPVTGLPTDSILNPVAQPTSTTTYYVSFTGSNGCIRRDSLKVNVNGVGQPIIAKASPTSLCLGSSTTLTIVGNPAQCGQSVANVCTGNALVVQDGTTNTMQGGTASAYPSPYGNYYKSARHQYLFKASELLALIGSGGKLTSLALNIGNLLSATPLPNFTIKVGCTQVDSITAYVNLGLVTVFTPKTVTPTAGWNTHIFDFAYDWDGSSNLIVDICFNATTNLNSNNKMRYTATSYRSQWFTWNNGSDMCGSTGAQPTTPVYATFFQRPDTRFGVCVANLNNANIQWTPVGSPGFITNPTNDTTTAFPIQPVTFHVSLTDTNGCISNDFITVNVDTSTRFTLSNDTFICSIVPVKLDATITGAINPNSLTYTWTRYPMSSPVPASGTGTAFAHPTVNPTVPTTYYCTVSGGPCVFTDSVHVIVGNNIPVNITIDSIKCFGQSTAHLHAVLTGGVSPITYSWNVGGNTDSLINQPIGMYIVNVTDAQGCSGKDTVIVTQPSALSLLMDSINIPCFGQNNGSISATVSGGQPNYTYTWSPTKPNVANINSLSPGLYQLTVTDANGCTISGQRNVTQPSAPLSSTMVTTVVSGSGMTDGRAHVYPSGGTIPYTFIWSDGTNIDSIINKGVGTYYVTICDAKGCCIQDTAIIPSPPPINLIPASQNNPCYGESLGWATFSASGGVLPYTYLWSTGSNNDTIYNLPAGIYTVTVTDANLISVTAAITITQPAALTLILDSVNVLCNAQGNGSITATVTGGNPNYTYTWNPTQPNAPIISSLSPGFYQLTVTDLNGCTITGNRNITEPTPLASIMTVNNVTGFGLNNGSASVLVSGGKAPYTYAWSDGSVTDSIKNKAATTYYVTICDANGCCIQDTAVITSPPPIVMISSSTNNLCFGNNNAWATFAVLGGVPPYSYLWSNASTNDTIYNLIAGTYYLTVRDSNGISKVDSVKITQPNALTLSFDSVQIKCYNQCTGKLRAIVAGGVTPYSFIWSNGTTADSTTNLCAALYSVTITDANGCSLSASASLSQPPLLSIVVINTDSVKCYGGQDGVATVLATGGVPNYNYVWSNSSQTTAIVNDLSAVSGQSVTVTDANQCTASVGFDIYQPAPLQISLNTIASHCFESNDGSASVTIVGGIAPYRYLWDNVLGSNNQSSIQFGTHNLQVLDANNCSATQSFFIDTFYVLHASAIADSTLCFGSSDGSATVSVANGNAPYTYLWSPIGGTGITATGLSANTYSVLVTDLYQCTTTASATVFQPAAMLLTLGHNNPLCTNDNNGKAWVTVTNGKQPLSYLWSNNNLTDSCFNLTSGVVKITVTDANFCQATDSVILLNPPSLQNNSQLTAISCSNQRDGIIQINTSGGTSPYHYQWSDNYQDTSVHTQLGAGAYAVTVSDINQCDTVLQFTFTAPPPLEFLVAKADSASCPDYTDGDIRLEVIGGSPGTTQAYSYSIDGVNFQSSPIFTGLSKGGYHITIRDGNNCELDTTLFVGEPVPMSVAIYPQDSTIELGSQVHLFATTQPYSGNQINSYTWLNPDGLSCGDCSNPVASPYYDMTYNLIVNYLNDCKSSAIVKVFVNDGRDFYVPSAFSPNGDGNNDQFEIYGKSLKTISLKIFNRWGEKVFDSENQWLGWDGNFKGVMQPPGIYTYVVDVTYLNGKKKLKNGSITLIR